MLQHQKFLKNTVVGSVYVNNIKSPIQIEKRLKYLLKMKEKKDWEKKK